jgi:hypothetical protein
MRKNFELTFIGHNLVKFNTTIFVILSYVLLYFIYSKTRNLTGLSFQTYSQFQLGAGIIVPLIIYCAYTIYKGQEDSPKILAFTFIVIWIMLIINLSLSGIDKVHLSIIFLYIIISFYCYQLWGKELSLACFNPQFTVFDIELKTDMNLNCVLRSGSQEYSATLLNWDDESCFILFEKPTKLNGEIELDVKINGHHFHDKFLVVSEYAEYQGIGLRILNLNKNSSWKNLYDILSERGILA